MNKKLEKLYRYCKANGYDESCETFESDLNQLLIQQVEGDELSMVAGGRNATKTLTATLISVLSIASPFASANQNSTSINLSTKNVSSVSSSKDAPSNKKSRMDLLKNILLKGVLPVAGLGTVGICLEELIRRKPWEKKDTKPANQTSEKVLQKQKERHQAKEEKPNADEQAKKEQEKQEREKAFEAIAQDIEKLERLKQQKEEEEQKRQAEAQRRAEEEKRRLEEQRKQQEAERQRKAQATRIAKEAIEELAQFRVEQEAQLRAEQEAQRQAEKVKAEGMDREHNLLWGDISELAQLRAERNKVLSSEDLAQFMFDRVNQFIINMKKAAVAYCNGIDAETLAEACVGEALKRSDDVLSAVREIYIGLEYKALHNGNSWKKALKGIVLLPEDRKHLDQVGDFGLEFVEILRHKSKELCKSLPSDEYLKRCFGDMTNLKFLSAEDTSHAKEMINQILNTLGLSSFESLKEYVCDDVAKNVDSDFPRNYNDIIFGGQDYIYGYLCQSLQGYLFENNSNEYSLHPNSNGGYLRKEDYWNRLVMSCAFAESDEIHNINKQKLEKIWKCIEILNKNLECSYECDIHAISENAIKGLRTIATDSDGFFDFRGNYNSDKLVKLLEFVGCLYSKFEDESPEVLYKSRIQYDGNEYTLKNFLKMELNNGRETFCPTAVIVLGDEEETSIPFKCSCYISYGIRKYLLELSDLTITRQERAKIAAALGSFEFDYYMSRKSFDDINYLIDYASQNGLLNPHISLDDIRNPNGDKFKADNYNNCLSALFMKIWRTLFGENATVNWMITVDDICSTCYFLASVLLSGQFANNERMLGFIDKMNNFGFIPSQSLNKYNELIEHINGNYTLEQNINWIKEYTYIDPIGSGLLQELHIR